MRVVSLLPSATEILALLDAEDLLVARSHACDAPARLAHLPAVTAPRVVYDPDEASPSGTVDARLRAAANRGESLFTLDRDALAALRPDLILTQDLCGVCAVDPSALQSLAEGLTPRPEILALGPQTVEGAIDDLIRVGRAIGREARGARAAVDLSARMLRAQEFVNAYEQGPVVGFMEWTDPIYVAGHWNVQLIERAGGRHPLNETVADAEAGAATGLQQGQRRAGKSIAVSPEVFAASRPDWLVIAPCGLSLEQTRREAQRLAGQDWFRQLPAVRHGRVALVDGSQMFNRPGPRLVDAFEWLVGWIQGRADLIPPGFPWKEGIG
ncbi:MAG: ABC transporter substrate-binding protein [Phycisphaerales bacterium JB059]